MPDFDVNKVVTYVEQNIGTFHQKRIESLNGLSLKNVLSRKNPYLFKAKHVLTAPELVKQITDAQVSSSEETIFGDWLEGLAIFINSEVYGGWKSSTAGIDLEFDKESVRFIVAIKSGPNWGNSTQIAKLRDLFKVAQRTLRTGNSGLQVVAVNGCCYGRCVTTDLGDYYKYCGQRFWEFISGDADLYTDIIEPLGHQAKERNEEFQESYTQAINRFTRDFTNIFCDDQGKIDWRLITEMVSATTPPLLVDRSRSVIEQVLPLADETPPEPEN